MFVDTILHNFMQKQQLYYDDLYKFTSLRNTLLYICGILFIGLLLQQVLRLIIDLKKLPPGPYGIPVLGYLAFVGNERHTKYHELAKKYGSIFSARLGCQLNVVISDYKTIREAFKTYDFINRPKTPLMDVINGFGIINSEGRLWKDQRRFLNEKLRHFGMTYLGNRKEQMETRIMAEVNELVETLYNFEGTEIDMNGLLSVSISNVICNLIMSVRFSHDDPRFKRFNWLIDEGFRLFGEVHMIDYIPLIQYLPGNINAKSKILQNRCEMFSFYRDVIEQHRNTFDPNNLRDLVDTYLYEIKKAKEDGCEQELFDGRDCDEQIMQVISDLFSAGMETIKTTLLWLQVFMLRNPDALKRCQDELDAVIGRNRMPSIDDVPYLPTTEATILEVLRITSIVPLATTHSPARDIEINGYKIPAGSHVVPLINSVHMDPNLWDKPEEFNPNRFIDSEGKVRKPEYFIPFGVGRRKCLGDILARMELFLYFASLIHRFDLSVPAGSPLPSLKGNVGVTISPQSFKIKLKARPMAPTCIDTEILRNVGSY
ncbi:cytochrome P450 18a1 [Culicoides brevitarsis]|uniref:cytochrome P450 18a1 n=1 Tax=Culicoides brevitarsis TaxID=469753 RepID=UPI00307C8190